MVDSNFQGYAKDVVHHGYASVVVLTVVLCECLSTLEDEVQYIWLSPWSKTKCTYLFARYFAVVYLTANFVFSLVWPPPLPVSQPRCTSWHLQNISCFYAQYIASHITLSRRILETYEVRNIGSALLVFHAAELAGGVVSGKDTLSVMSFNGVCDMVNVPKNVFVFVAMLLLSQVLMWGLILSGHSRRGGADAPRADFREMVYRMWYDGEAKVAWAICCLFFVANAYRGNAGQAVKPIYLFVWPICLLSIGTCRYILSMERNANTHARISSPKCNSAERELHTCNDGNSAEDLSLGSYCPEPCEPQASVDSTTSTGPYVMRVSSSDSFETLTLDSLKWKHPSCLQGAFDGGIKMSDSSSDVSSDLTRRTSTTSTSSSMSTLRLSSISSHMTQETEITAPSIGTRSSIDIDIGSLHSSSSVTSEELRDVWNEVWSGDEHAFMHA
ncbi:hypothetical protein D9619_010647 [Psilocybe cf. subviscida]|uniref:DUF6533 domain-containing protein n=1 Tax=Psilocybe cf. subviscida TaxID=2480587 RepID=A0A8H5BAQ3_9AGAR|nr:hypothetical protein D9619_010647 [Psilocybe cf. subviscida]